MAVLILLHCVRAPLVKIDTLNKTHAINMYMNIKHTDLNITDPLKYPLCTLIPNYYLGHLHAPGGESVPLNQHLVPLNVVFTVMSGRHTSIVTSGSSSELGV